MARPHPFCPGEGNICAAAKGEIVLQHGSRPRQNAASLTESRSPTARPALAQQPKGAQRPGFCNSKKGVTLIELACALAVAAVAVAIGAQLFVVGARATANSRILDTNTKAIVRFYESGQVDALSRCTAEGKTVSPTQTSTTVRIQLGGVSLEAQGVMDTVTIEDGKTKTALSVLEGSIGNGAAG